MADDDGTRRTDDAADDRMLVEINLRSVSRTLKLGAAASNDDGDDCVAPMFSDVWLGTELWPAATVLTNFIDQDATWRSRLSRARCVIDLGSGTGACGLAAAALGASRVLLTDMISLVPTLQDNAISNGFAPPGVTCMALAWGDALPTAELRQTGADVVLMSDCLNPVYGAAHATALASTLRELLERANAGAGTNAHEDEAAALLSQTRRGHQLAEASFFDACSQTGLEATLLMEAPGQQQVALYSMRMARQPEVRCQVNSSSSVSGSVSGSSVGGSSSVSSSAREPITICHEQRTTPTTSPTTHPPTPTSTLPPRPTPI